MIVLTDLDHTLVAENSTYGFVQAALERAGRGDEAEAVGRIHSRRGGRGILFAAVHSTLGADLARPWALGRLRGLPRALLEEVGRSYAREMWTRSPLEAPRRRVEELRREDGEVVVVSASVEEVVAPVAEILGASYQASRLAYDDEGRCSGALARDLTGRKVVAVEEILARGEPVAVLTDNLTDFDLVERADRRLVVLRRASERSAWSSLDPEFLEVEG